jgi:hypothetical protein
MPGLARSTKVNLVQSNELARSLHLLQVPIAVDFITPAKMAVATTITQ